MEIMRGNLMELDALLQRSQGRRSDQVLSCASSRFCKYSASRSGLAQNLLGKDEADLRFGPIQRGEALRRRLLAAVLGSLARWRESVWRELLSGSVKTRSRDTWGRLGPTLLS